MQQLGVKMNCDVSSNIPVAFVDGNSSDDTSLLFADEDSDTNGSAADYFNESLVY